MMNSLERIIYYRYYYSFYGSTDLSMFIFLALQRQTVTCYLPKLWEEGICT